MRHLVLSLVMIGLFGKPAQSDLNEHRREINMISISVTEILYGTSYAQWKNMTDLQRSNAYLAARSSNKKAFSIYNQLSAKTKELWFVGARLRNGYPYCWVEPYEVNGSTYASQDCIAARIAWDARVRATSHFVAVLRDLSKTVCSQTTNISQNLWELIANKFRLNPRNVKLEIVEKQSVSDMHLIDGLTMPSLECHLKIYVENGVCNVRVAVVNGVAGDPIFHQSAYSTCS